MKSGTKLALVVSGAGLALIAGTYNAFASWTSEIPTTTLRVTTAELPAGEVPLVAKSGEDVELSWKSSVAGDVQVRKYTVTRHGDGKPVVVCNRVAATKCTDKKVPDGTWTWRVRPMLGTWEGKDSADSKQLVLAAAKKTPTGVGTATPTAVATQTAGGGDETAAPPPAPAATTEPPKQTKPVPAEATTTEPPPPVATSDPAPDEPPATVDADQK